MYLDNLILYIYIYIYIYNEAQGLKSNASYKLPIGSYAEVLSQNATTAVRIWAEQPQSVRMSTSDVEMSLR